ncbi:hypothetical protein C8J57DRAFT_1736917 [Mycena rebaudengoi]|nr:hypothetical protein C8J57DRAFT_1736917 [Mycena rebaudengoi]
MKSQFRTRSLHERNAYLAATQFVLIPLEMTLERGLRVFATPPRFLAKLDYPARRRRRSDPEAPTRPHKLPVREEIRATALQATTTALYILLRARAVLPPEGTRCSPTHSHARAPPVLDARAPTALTILLHLSCTSQPSLIVLPPQSYRAIPSPLSAHTSKRSRALDAVPLTTIPKSTTADSSSWSTSAAADALYAHTLHTLQNRLSTL